MKNDEKKNNSKRDKDIISGIKEEFKRHTNILTEQIKTEVKVVAEGHSDITRKLEEHDKKFDQMDQRFDRIEQAVISLKTEVKELKTEVKGIQTEVKELKTEVKGINEKLDQNLDNHEKRLVKLEEKVLT